MDQGTQENAAMVGEGASAASALNHHAQQLLNAVNAFRPSVPRAS